MNSVFAIQRKKTGAYVSNFGGKGAVRCSHKRALIHDSLDSVLIRWDFGVLDGELNEENFEIVKIPLTKLKDKVLAELLSKRSWFYPFIAEVEK
ncbi:hypothetical protein [Streptococcus marmotae]|uniref:hypothetical protein n=1 Tax=Streptococcus marmotae TaxID=1825069 RepID=UPI00082DD140|nr:hypothetical protein [Streptococcus marmotae]